MIQASESAREMEWEKFMAELQAPKVKPAHTMETLTPAEFAAFVEQQDMEWKRNHARAMRFAAAYLFLLGVLGVGCWLILRQW